MLIHAYRRKLATPIDTGTTRIEFEPNEKGDVVAEVESSEDCEKLLAITEAFCQYAKPQDEVKTAFVVTNGETTLDLSTMDSAALRAFAEANDVAVHHKNADDTIRQKIVDALTAK